jgi:hypothetical protein
VNRRAVLESLMASDDGRKLCLAIPDALFGLPPQWDQLIGRKAMVCLISGNVSKHESAMEFYRGQHETVVVSAVLALNLRMRAPLPTEDTPQPTEQRHESPTRRVMGVMTCDPVTFVRQSVMASVRSGVPLLYYSVSWIGNYGKLEHMAAPFPDEVKTNGKNLTIPFEEGIVTFAP